MANVLEMAIALKGKLDNSLPESFKKAAAQAQGLSKSLSSAFNGANKQMSGLSAQIKASSDKLREAQAALRASTTKTGIAIYSQRTNYINAKAAIQQYSQEIEQLRKRQESLQTAMKNQAAAQSRFNQARGRLGSAALTVGVAAAPLGAAINEAMKYESVMADVRKVVDFDTPQQFKEMNADIMQLSQRLPMTAEGIAKIVAAGGQAGIAREDLTQFAEAAAKMGVAFDITADQAGEMMAKWRTAFGMNQEQVVTLADKINYLSNVTAAGSDSISDIVTRVGPLGEVAGVNAGQIAALGASIASTGAQSDVAATGIKNMMLGLSAGAGATKSQAAAFLQLGTTAESVAARMQTDAEGTIVDILTRIKALPKEMQSSVLADMFGTESIGAIAPLLTQLDGLKENFRRVGDASQYAGSMEKEYEARSQTTENQLQLTKNSLTALAVNIGTVLLPSINALLQGAASIVTPIAQWSQQNPELTKGILAVAGAIAGLIMTMLAVNTVVAGWKSLVASFSLFTQTTKLAAAAQWVLNAAMAANPIILIVMAVIALVAALVYLWNTNEGFRNAVIAIWNSIKTTIINAFNAVVSFLSTAITTIVGFITNLPTLIAFGIGFIIGIMTQLPNIIAGAIMAAGTFLMNLPAYCVSAGIAFVGAAEAWLSLAYNTAVTWISNLVDSVYEFLLRLPDYCASAGASFVESARQWASDAYNAIMDWITRIPNAISNALSGIWDTLTGSLQSGINVGVSVAHNAAGGIYGKGAFLTTFAEQSAEAAIPLDGSKRSVGLWQQAGSMLGIEPTGSAPITFAPTINIQGGSTSTAQEVAEALERERLRFEDMMNRMLRRQRRLSYE